MHDFIVGREQYTRGGPQTKPMIELRKNTTLSAILTEEFGSDDLEDCSQANGDGMDYIQVGVLDDSETGLTILFG